MYLGLQTSVSYACISSSDYEIPQDAERRQRARTAAAEAQLDAQQRLAFAREATLPIGAQNGIVPPTPRHTLFHDAFQAQNGRRVHLAQANQGQQNNRQE